MQEGMKCWSNEVPDNVTIHQIGSANRSLSTIEWWYSNIKRDAMYVLHGLKTSHHYCFAREVHVITDHKPLEAMISKYMVMLSQQLQCIMLCKYKYSVQILYKPGSELFIADWLSQTHLENQDQEIPGLNVGIPTISTLVDVPICASIEDIKEAIEEDIELEMLKRYIIDRLPDSRKAVEKGVEKYWLIRCEFAIIDCIAMWSKCIIKPCILQRQILERLGSNHIGHKNDYSWENHCTGSTWVLTLTRLSSSVPLLPWISTHRAAWESTALWYTIKNLGCSWYWHICSY